MPDSRIHADPSDNVVGTGDVDGERAVIAGLEVGYTYTVSVSCLSDKREGEFTFYALFYSNNTL